MNVYKNIKTAKYYIGKLKESLVRMKSEKQQSFYIDMINSFIELVNVAEMLANAHKQTDIIDSLLLARIAEYLNNYEYRSYNWSQNVYVVEREGQELKLLGFIETDAIVQANYILNSDTDVQDINIEVNNDQKVVGRFNAETSKQLVEQMFETKMREIDMSSLVREIKMDVTYHPEMNMDKVISFFMNHDTINDVGVPYSAQKWKEMVNNLLDKFKETMSWK